MGRPTVSVKRSLVLGNVATKLQQVRGGLSRYYPTDLQLGNESVAVLGKLWVAGDVGT